MSIWNPYARLQRMGTNARGVFESHKVDGALNRELKQLGTNTPRIGGIDGVLRNEQRKLHARERLLRKLLPAPTSASLVKAVKARSELRLRLARLKPVEARILVRSAMGETLSTLALDEKLPLGTVKSHLSRGRVKFKR